LHKIGLRLKKAHSKILVAQEPTMNSGGSILIVDDEFGVRESLRMILKPFFSIYAASDGKEALKFIQEHKIDLITLDLRMPGLSGIETLREIKKINKDIDIIIITAYGSLENAKESIGYGVKDFITKPFNPADVLYIINKAIESRNDKMKVRNLVQHIESLSLEALCSLGPGRKEIEGDIGKDHPGSTET
jgi:YesN/AraC family two-component response regulator